MSGRATKRLKPNAVASAGGPTIDFLPPELLETICGFLDVRTLCTARLVSTQFNGAASRCIHSVKLSVETVRSRPETTLNNFPNLSQVSIRDVKKDDLLMLAQSPVADAVTHLRAVEYLRPVPRRTRNAPGLPLLPLPDLTSLTVNFASHHAFQFPRTLRELVLQSPVTVRAANLVTRLTNLTSLRIALHKPFKGVTALTSLQSLEIYCELSLIPFVAELTQLTHLLFQEKGGPTSLSDLAPLVSLTRLHKLVHLGFKKFSASLEPHLLASAAMFSSLKSLDLDFFPWKRSAFETVCMAPFSQLTALRLESTGPGFGASFLPRFNLERLQDLSLSDGWHLDRDGVAALRRATGLTHLNLSITTVGGSAGLEELGIALPRMSQLRALSLSTPSNRRALYLGNPGAAHATFPLKPIARLTELTRLEVSVTTNADAEVCLGLKNLRVLHTDIPISTPAPSDCITPGTLFALAKLLELRKFSICGNVDILGEYLSANAWASLKADRHEKGWPPLKLEVWVSR